ncbi:receptor-interacting serine/threonine-protein kinase 1 isoform X1 [Polypterus senegalus]|uniref:receptor-interacting serine/threonine-protein kinase 1 isoform X1 n=1 Tax=Polypterus senegalus TaxID=55291 RepID=UPI001963C44D|nr:receptor-interacting serine/threonine-protein kinase 1 isoform X1 [Polypterus senegalus]
MALDSIRIHSHELTEKEQIDCGGCGVVYICLHATHGLVVLKTVYTGPHRTEFNKSLLEEGKLMKKLNHERVVKLLGVVLEEGNYSLVMEYLPKGNLLKMLQSVSVALSIKGRIILEIIEGMSYLNQNNVVHKDLKPENILLDENFHVKIADLGLAICQTWSKLTKEESRRQSRLGNKPQSNAGTLCYMAPEHLKQINTKPTEKSDVYSFGIVVWVILANKEPYEYAQGECHLYHCISEGNRPDMSELASDTPREFLDLMVSCWNGDPKERPSFTECNAIFCPFYMNNLYHRVEGDLRDLRKAYQGPKECIEKMKSLTIESSPSESDHPYSLHSQGSSEESNELVNIAAFNRQTSIQIDAQSDNDILQQKLDEEWMYHAHGSRLDQQRSQVSGSRADPVYEERNRRVSSNPHYEKKSFAQSRLPSENEVPVGFPVSESHHLSFFPIGEETERNQQNFPRYSNQAYAGMPKTPVYNVPLPRMISRPAGYPIPESNNPDTISETPMTPQNNYPSTEMGNTNIPTFDSRAGLDGSFLPIPGIQTGSGLYINNVTGMQIGHNNYMSIGNQAFSSFENLHENIEDMIKTYENYPVMEAHMELVRNSLGKKWKHCARKLGFEEPDIEEIDHDYERDGLKEKVYQMLEKWKMREGQQGTTVGKLCRALQSCSKRDLPIKLLEMCKDVA